MSKDHQSNDPWDLITAHRYDEAVAAYDAKLAACEEKTPAIIANRAIALLCLGRLSEALEGFAAANDIARRSWGGRSAPFLESMGTVLWLMGHRSIAKELYRSAVDGRRYRTIHGARDIAGGVGPGLLLWYAGITTEDRNATEHAVDYLTHLAKKSRIKYWPGPLALFVIERRAQSLLPRAQSFQELLSDSFETGNLLEITEQAKSDILKRRELIQALFVLGTKRRNKGDEDGCRRTFQQCTQLENPHIEEEWYLAAAEVGLFPPGV